MKLCGFEIGLDKPFFLIAGPCVIESRQLAIDTAGALKEMTSELGIPFIYKSSYDKANRSSSSSFRGPGMEKGLDILADVKKQFNIPVLTDVHTEWEIVPVARTVDVLQTPAFLCRQTDFIQACARSGKPVNIKKGQFLAPDDMTNVVIKAKEAAREAGLSEDSFTVCERAPSYSTPPIRSSCREDWAMPLADNVNLSLFWPAPPLPLALPVSSWKHTRIRPKRNPMVPMPSRWTA